MKSIGIIGSDSTHTENFAGILNRDVAVSSLRATKLWGADPVQAREKAAMAEIPTVVERPEDAMDGVDAVMVLNRWGVDHFEPARLALERGLPLFVDKPMTDDPDQAVELTRAATQAGVGFMSASALRYDHNLLELGQTLESMGPLRGLSFALPNDWVLYGVHAVDVLHALLGSGVRDVTSVRDEQNDLVILRWSGGRFGIVTQMRESLRIMQCTGYTARGWAAAEASPADEEGGYPRYYVDTVRVFERMLQSAEWPIDAVEMVDVIRVFAAVDIAAREGRTVELREIPAL